MQVMAAILEQALGEVQLQKGVGNFLLRELDVTRDKAQMTQVIIAAGEQVLAPGQVDERLGLEHRGQHHRLIRRRSHRRGREAKRLLVVVERTTDVVTGSETPAAITPSTGTEVGVDRTAAATHTALGAVQGGQRRGTEKGQRTHDDTLLL